MDLSTCVWNLSAPGIKPVSFALAGRFPTTGPPGKSPDVSFIKYHSGFFRDSFLGMRLMYKSVDFDESR